MGSGECVGCWGRGWGEEGGADEVGAGDDGGGWGGGFAEAWGGVEEVGVCGLLEDGGEGAVDEVGLLRVGFLLGI